MIPSLDTERMWFRPVRLEDAEQVQKDGSMPLYVGKGNIKHHRRTTEQKKRPAMGSVQLVRRSRPYLGLWQPPPSMVAR
jgi:hypothetical protein